MAQIGSLAPKDVPWQGCPQGLATLQALQVGPGLVQTPRTGNFPQSMARAAFPALLNLSCCCFPTAQAVLKALSHHFRTFSCDL